MLRTAELPVAGNLGQPLGPVAVVAVVAFHAARWTDFRTHPYICCPKVSRFFFVGRKVAGLS